MYVRNVQLPVVHVYSQRSAHGAVLRDIAFSKLFEFIACPFLVTGTPVTVIRCRQSVGACFRFRQNKPHH